MSSRVAPSGRVLEKDCCEQRGGEVMSGHVLPERVEFFGPDVPYLAFFYQGKGRRSFIAEGVKRNREVWVGCLSRENPAVGRKSGSQLICFRMRIEKRDSPASDEFMFAQSTKERRKEKLRRISDRVQLRGDSL
jgi:hypothetical protein